MDTSERIEEIGKQGRLESELFINLIHVSKSDTFGLFLPILLLGFALISFAWWLRGRLDKIDGQFHNVGISLNSITRAFGGFLTLLKVKGSINESDEGNLLKIMGIGYLTKHAYYKTVIFSNDFNDL